MIKSQLIEIIAATTKYHKLSEKKVADSVNEIIDLMAETLAANSRIEIRGFGSFSLHHRESRQTRNPKTGEVVFSEAKHKAHFRPGKDLRDRVNESRHRYPLITED